MISKLFSSRPRPSRALPNAAPVAPQPPAFNPKVRWWSNPDWLRRFDRYVRPDSFTGEHHHRILDRRFTMQSFTESVRRLPGSTAECGVFKGIGSSLICATLAGSYEEGARHYGFDSFEGLPEPTGEDAGSAWARGQLNTPLEETRRRLAEFPFCELRVGWIPQTFAGLEAQRFRLIHIDVDLAEPTRDSLEFFYPRAVAGALFLFDDYGFHSCPGARRATDEFLRDKPEVLVELTTGQAFFYKK
jgi:O-methyltransferase